MSPDHSFEALIVRAQDGDQQAARAIFERYAHQLIVLARTRLDVRTLQKLDPEDVVQSVFRSFFQRLAHDEYELENWKSLWSLLTVITLRKCGFYVRHFRAARRNVTRERAARAASDSKISWQFIAREPTPSEAVLLTETLEAVLHDLEPGHREIVELHLRGFELPQISERVERSERTVYRLLERVRRRLERMCGEDLERKPNP